MPEVSIVMTAYKRAKQLEKTLASIFKQDFKDYEVIVVDDGGDDAQRIVCRAYPYIKYIVRPHRPGTFYSNPAIPNNIGMRAAMGNIILLQNAENMHVSPEVINNLVEPVRQNEKITTFASVLALTETNAPWQWYTHSKYNARPFFFCQAIRRSVVEELRGFDEDYIYYGFDDDDFADRQRVLGMEFKFMDNIRVHHQWHTSGDAFNSHINQQVYLQKTVDMAAGKIGVARNLGRDWGKLEDANT